MASPDEAAADDSVPCKREKKTYMLETKQCLIYARDNLPPEVYQEFLRTMTGIWKQSADPDGEIRSISAGSCIETAMKLLQGWAPVKEGFLNFTQGRSPFDGGDNVYGNACAQIQSPLVFLQRAKACPGISEDDYAAMLQALIKFARKRTTPREVFHIVKGCLSNCPKLLVEFTNNFLPPDLKALLADDKSCRNPKTGRVVKAALCFTPDANHSLDGTQIKVTNMWKEGSEESFLAEEDEEDNVKSLPDWIESRQDKLPPKVKPEDCTPCTPSYYLLPHNCITLQSSYRTKLGRSTLNDALISHQSVGSLEKTSNDYEKKVMKCEDEMYESDMLLQRFRATADFIANLQDRAGSGLRINEHITPLHRRCIEKLYDDDLELYNLLERQTTSAALSILLHRLNQRIENLSDARLSLQKILSPLIAENYYKSLDHRGPSFKQLDAKRMGHKALLAEAKEIHKSRLNAGDEYANPDIHKDIRRIISSVRSSEESLTMTWTKVVHPFLSANCLRSYLEETVAPSEACEHCGISKDFLSRISDALVANKLPLSPNKEGELLRKPYNESSSSRHGFDVEIEEGEFIPDVQMTKSDSMLGPGEGPARASCDVAAFDGHPGTDTSTLSSCAHGNEPEKKNEPRQLSKRTTKPRGVKGGTCCSLVVLCRLYEILYKRLQRARDLCTGDLYTEFKEQLCRLLVRSIDNYKFEDFCLKYLGPNSFELFTLDMVINRVIKQLCVISSSDSLVQFLEELLKRPIPPQLLSQHRNPSSGWLVREEQDGKLSLHFERRKKRKLENDASSPSQPGGRDPGS